MSGEWEIKCLAEVSNDVSYGYTASATHDAVGPRFLRITDIQGGVVNWSKVPFCSITETDELKYQLQKGDIVVARTGNSTGENYMMSRNLNAVFASYLIRFRIDSDVADPGYVWYNMRSDRWRRFLSGCKTGSAQAGANARVLGAFEIPLPPLPEQRRIAKILGDLDDKIELNRKMNETLEQMARALFKSWFVDFDPVRAKMEGRTPTGMDAATAALFPDRLVDSELGPIPEGWEVKALGEVVDVVDCLHAKKPDRVEDGKLFLQLNNIRQDGLLDLSDCYMISDVDYAKWISRMEAQAGDCVITNVGRVGAVAQIPEGTRCALGRNMTGIRCKAHFDFPAFLVTCMLSDWMKEEIVRKVDTGTILDALNVKSIPKLRLIVPSADLLAVSEPILRSIRKSMEHQTQQSSTLSTLRDTLLPKLVSGEVRVNQSLN